MLEKETLALPDIVDILGPRPYPLKQSLLEYMEELKQRAVDMEAEEEAKLKAYLKQREIEKIEELTQTWRGKEE